jgi:hypothetical protein
MLKEIVLVAMLPALSLAVIFNTPPVSLVSAGIGKLTLAKEYEFFVSKEVILNPPASISASSVLSVMVPIIGYDLPFSKVLPSAGDVIVITGGVISLSSLEQAKTVAIVNSTTKNVKFLIFDEFIFMIKLNS